MHARRRLLALCLVAPTLAGCAAGTIPATARLPRPERVYVEDFHAPAAAVEVDTNQFSYVMEGFAMPRDARSRQADATAAKVALRETLLTQLRALGFDARPGPPARVTGNALIISGSITNIIEAIPSDLSTFAVGHPGSQVNARSVIFYQYAGQAPRRWQDFAVNAPVVPDSDASAPEDGLAINYVMPEPADARTREVAAQTHRLGLRLAARLRALFVAEDWVSPAPPVR